MRKQTETCRVCREIAGELQDLLGWLAGGDLTPEQYRCTVAMLQQRKLRRYHMQLDSAVSEGDMVHFSLRFVNSGELCASMDVNCKTGDTEVQLACAW
jgi:hypothetical protein